MRALVSDKLIVYSLDCNAGFEFKINDYGAELKLAPKEASNYYPSSRFYSYVF